MTKVKDLENCCTFAEYWFKIVNMIEMIKQEQIHIGWVKYFNTKGYGFIVDFVDNSEYFFRKSTQEMKNLPDYVLIFKTRRSSRYEDKLEAYSLMPPYNCKEKILLNLAFFPKEIQIILSLYLPSTLYKLDSTYYFMKVKELLIKYDLLASELYDYVRKFDLDKYLESYSVKTDFYRSYSTKDWDINMLSYQGVIGEQYCKLQNIYMRCQHYEEPLVWGDFDQHYRAYNSFDIYLESLSKKFQEIKTTEAYGYDRHFWDDIDKDEIEAKIPGIIADWTDKIRSEYKKENHIKCLISHLQSRFAALIKDIPRVIDSYGRRTQYVETPHMDITINYTNASLQFRTTSYVSAKGYGYELTHVSNGKKTCFNYSNMLVYDADFIELKKEVIEIESKAIFFR